jgi:uncharacterized protein YndB with AHSA1/START domain
MAEHAATVTVDAPVHQVYELFTHFNDFPKFMTFVKEVTYQDSQKSHWVADVAGRHEWDAVNEDWIPDRQVGWRSTDGLENSGRVTFQDRNGKTSVFVQINYDPPAGFLGDIAESLGSGKHFENALQHDLENFAQMVAESPPGALDPMSSDYLFHEDSAAAKGQATPRQEEAMLQSQGQQSQDANTGWQGAPPRRSDTDMKSDPLSATGYNTDSTEASPDSAPTTGTASWGGEMVGAKGGQTTAGTAETIANLNNPITPERKEQATGVESEESDELGDDI